MVNLVKNCATRPPYPGRSTHAAKALTGRKPYKNYGAESGRCWQQIRRGSILGAAQFETTLIGRRDEGRGL